MGYGNILAHSLKSLQQTAENYLRQEQIDAAGKTIQNCSVIAAVSGVGAGWIPGAGGVISAGAMTITVWTMYVKINKDLQIPIKDNVLKFIASAIVSNLAINAGSIVAILAVSTALSFIPGLGSIPAAILVGVAGYIVVYAAAVLYIKLLVKVFKAKGGFESLAEDGLKEIIKDLSKASDMKSIVKEAKEQYKTAKKNGEIDAAKEAYSTEE